MRDIARLACFPQLDMDGQGKDSFIRLSPLMMKWTEVDCPVVPGVAWLRLLYSGVLKDLAAPACAGPLRDGTPEDRYTGLDA